MVKGEGGKGRSSRWAVEDERLKRERKGKHGEHGVIKSCVDGEEKGMAESMLVYERVNERKRARMGK